MVLRPDKAQPSKIELYLPRQALLRRVFHVSAAKETEMAKRPSPAAKSERKPVAAEPAAEPVAVVATISAPEVHKALDVYRTASERADEVGRPAIEAEASALKHLSDVSGLTLSGSLSSITAKVKAALAGVNGG